MSDDPRLDLIDACAGNPDLVAFAKTLIDTNIRLTEAASVAWDAIPSDITATSLADAITQLAEQRKTAQGEAFALGRKATLRLFAAIETPEVQGAVAVLREEWR